VSHPDPRAVVSATAADHMHRSSGRAGSQPFSREEFAVRLARVQEAMAEGGLDVLLVHTPENLAYLTGYETSGYFEYQVLVVPAQGEPELLIRNIEQLNVDEYTWVPEAHVWRDGTDVVAVTAGIVAGLTANGTVGIEAHSWFVTAAIAERLEGALAGYRVIAAGRLVELIRLVKSTAELAYIRVAAAIADATMAGAVDAAREGATELDVAAAAHSAQVLAGGEYPALPHYVTSGDRSEIGHATWTSKTLVRGELLKLEFLGVHRRYHAGLTRAVHIGPAGDEIAAAARLCIALQDETFAQLRPGASADQLTRDATTRAEAAGLTPIKMRLGYSMGIGFPPIAGEGQTADFRVGSPIELRAGMVFHMLSVMRVGLVFSDTVVITPDGFERLTQTPRVLREV
jgi:Xaa-Pro dipeptidase